MVQRAVLPLTLLLLAGCARPEYGWRDLHHDRTEATLNEDFGQCQAASMQTPVYPNPYDLVTSSVLGAQRQNYIVACMQGKGWQLVEIPGAGS